MPGLGTPPNLMSVKRRAHIARQSMSLESLRQDARKSVWYAFDTLNNANTGCVPKSQLKVVASTIGLALGFDKAEEILDKEPANEINFKDFLKLLEEGIFDKLTSSSIETLSLSKQDLDDVHKKCWTLFVRLKNPKGSQERLNKLGEHECYLLWRVFNFLAEEDENNIPILPMKMHIEEAEILLNCFVEITGQVAMVSEVRPFLTGYPDSVMSFEELESVILDKFAKNLNDTILKRAIKDIYDKFIGDTLIKGLMCKCGHSVKNWKDRWMVLTTKELSYFTSAEEKSRKGDVQIDSSCSVEIAPEKPGGKPNRFILRTQTKPYEMSAHDMKTRNEWVTALQKAIDKSKEKDYHFHRHEVTERRNKRIQKRKEEEDAERKKREEEERLRELMQKYDDQLKLGEEQLSEQRRALEASRLAQEELAERLRREEALRRELEKLLESEKQAKRDEEIVRALQARILEEEFEKRAELEKLKEEQDRLLQIEREHRQNMEEEKSLQKQKLEEAELRLRQLEIERESAEKNLEEASEKLLNAEKERCIMEQKMKLWKTPTVGLAKPVPLRDGAVTTHRGRGAFVEADFISKSKRCKDFSSAEQSLDTNNDSVKCNDSIENVNENICTDSLPENTVSCDKYSVQTNDEENIPECHENNADCVSQICENHECLNGETSLDTCENAENFVTETEAEAT